MSAVKPSLDDLRIDRDQGVGGRSRTWFWSVALLVLVLLGAGVLWLRPGGKVVRAAAARETELSEGATVLNASGYVTARRRATVSSKVTAKVLEVLVEEGMAVKAGQILARLDASNIDASLNLAEAELRAARSALEETRVQLAESMLRLKRTQALVGDNVLSQAELDRIQAETDSLQARLERQQEEEIVAERRVAVWKQQLEDTVIRAPFDGIVTTKNAQPGEMISPISARRASTSTRSSLPAIRRQGAVRTRTSTAGGTGNASAIAASTRRATMAGATMTAPVTRTTRMTSSQVILRRRPIIR